MGRKPDGLGYKQAEWLPWKPGTFWRAMSNAPFEQTGFTYRGVGVCRMEPGAKNRFWVIHLGTGHALCSIWAPFKVMLPVATEIAECGDWSFDGLEGWRNIDPEIQAKFYAVVGKYEFVHRGRMTTNTHDAKMARDIVFLRER